MPAGDRTGPAGMGPKTGRGMGYCGGYDSPGWSNTAPGRQPFGRGTAGRGGRRSDAAFGGGRGWRHWYYATGLPRWARWGTPSAAGYGVPAAPSPEHEVEMLKDEAACLQEQLEAINKRMDELSQE